MNTIKTINVYAASMDNEDQIIFEYKSHFEELDPSGRILQEINYTEDEEIESKTVNSFNEKGNLIEMTDYFNEYEISERKKYFYNENDILTEAILEYGDGSMSKEVYEYEEKAITTEVFDENDAFESREVKKADEEGYITEWTRYDADLKLENQILYVYDNNHHIIKKTEFRYNEDFASVNHFEYDSRGNQIKDITVSERGNIMNSRLSNFDENNNLIEEIVNDYKITYEYDSQGNRIRMEVAESHGKVTALYIYIYNEDGNLIEEKIYQINEDDTSEVLSHGYLRKRYLYQKFDS